MSSAHTQGPVPLGNDSYVQRAFELAIQREILSQRWVLLLGPRQHGKTSALLRLKERLVEQGLLCAFVDLQAMPPFTTYSELLRWFARRVSAEYKQAPPEPPTETDELGAWLQSAIPKSQQPCVIIVDEASGIANDAWRNAFFGQFRGIASERASAGPEDIAKRLRVVFSGTFRPETLVDERNSPFNVCERIEPEDFSRDDALTLGKRICPDAAEEWAGKVFDAVGGQPYLLQVLFSAIDQALPDNREAAFTAALDGLRAGTDDHIQGLFSRVIAEKSLSEIVARMAAAGSIPNEAASSDFKYLQVLGLARRQSTKLVFRNELYQQIASTSQQISVSAPLPAKPTQLLVVSASAFGFVKSDALREIVSTSHRAGVNSYNGHSFRMSLVAFGCALEAMLLDLMMTRSAAELAAAVRAGRPDFSKYEDSADPRRWRLVNLIKVAQQLPGGQNLKEPSAALRDWRNLIHPAVVLQNYLSEDQLEPEARSASGFVDSIRRDIASVT